MSELPDGLAGFNGSCGTPATRLIPAEPNGQDDVRRAHNTTVSNQTGPGRTGRSPRKHSTQHQDNRNRG
eukprot:1045768-Alexandrium_andersonii.AAC.1